MPTKAWFWEAVRKAHDKIRWKIRDRKCPKLKHFPTGKCEQVIRSKDRLPARPPFSRIAFAHSQQKKACLRT